MRSSEKNRNRYFFDFPYFNLSSMLEHLFCVKKKIYDENKMQEAME